MTTSYARGARDVELLDETIGANLRRTVERFGEREALVVAHQHYRATYAELWEQVDRAARALIAHGVRAGDRVGIWAPNRHEWVVIQFATARIGAILVTVNPAYKAAELRHALNQAGVSLLVLARGFRGTDYVALLDEVRGECAALRETVVLEDGWDSFLAGGERVTSEAVVAREFSLHPDDPINIQYTSGTTGAPKGATLSHRNIATACRGRIAHLQDPRALEDRRRLPDDDHRQDPEVPAARAGERVVTCMVCSQLISERGVAVHAECLAAGLLQEAVLAAALLIATVVAPTVIVWAG